MRRDAMAACLLTCLAMDRDASAQSTGSGPPTRPAGPTSAAHLADPFLVRKRLGLVPEYEHAPNVEALKVAVLDYGFDGMASGRPYLPDGAEVVEHYDPEFVRRFDLGDPDYRRPFEPFNRHGRVMAQIVWSVTGSRPGGPKFYLLNANGPTMLRRAVRFAIERKVDIILFCGSFEGGGNGDGHGPINRIVADALAADILWINAAGNYGHRVYNGPVRPLPEGYLRLRDGSEVASLRFRNHVDENTIVVTLTWNDYRGDEDAGTDKDLDLFVEDWAGRRVGAGEKVQVSGARVPGPQESRNPRERVVLADLAASPDLPNRPDYAYRIRVRARRGRFTAEDRIRILLTASREVYIPAGGDGLAEAVDFLDASGEGEIYPPADNPLAIAVGDTGPASSIGPTADGRAKPDVVLADSRAYFTDGEVSAGSSNAAAYFAGIVAVLRSAEPGLRAPHLLRLARQGTAVSRQDFSSSPFESSPTGSRGNVSGLPTDFSAATRTAGLSTIHADGRVSVLPSPPSAPTLGGSRPASARQTLRLWQTPSRARLAEIVRGGR